MRKCAEKRGFEDSLTLRPLPKEELCDAVASKAESEVGNSVRCQ